MSPDFQVLATANEFCIYVPYMPALSLGHLRGFGALCEFAIRVFFQKLHENLDPHFLASLIMLGYIVTQKENFLTPRRARVV